MACAAVVYASTKQLSKVSRAARHGTLRLGRLISRVPILHNGRPTGSETFQFAVRSHAPSEQETVVTHVARTKGNDVLTLSGTTHLLALVPPNAPADAILLLRDYYPLSLNEVERQRVDAAFAASAGG